MAAPLLRVEALTIRFPGAAPVQALDLAVDPRETLAIVGESGSGKSLTALALMGLLPHRATIASGRILFNGAEIQALPAHAMRRLRGRDIAMIFQEPMTSLNPVLTIGRQIGEVLATHTPLRGAAARARCVELLDLVRIPNAAGRLDDYPHQLSGGMRQRVMIAMAIACRPLLLVADEPTTALDVTIQAQVLSLLDGLRRELGMALILISHDLGLVAQWSDRVAVMYAGRKVEEAPADTVFEHPLHPYTRGLMRATPRVTQDAHYRLGPLAEIPGSIASAAFETGCPFLPRCGLAQPACATAVPPLQPAGPRRLVACPFAPVAGGAHGDP